jgi:hypothetical protein
LAASTLDVAGVPTAVIDTGLVLGAAPPVLLLHGSGPGVTAAANWHAVIPALSGDRRVIAQISSASAAPQPVSSAATAATPGPGTPWRCSTRSA